MPSRFEESYLRGSVRQVGEPPPKGTFVYHCAECQTPTGIAFSAVVAVPEGAFAVTGVTPSSYQTSGDDSERPVHRHFYELCGSPLYSVAEHCPGSVFIKARTLDDTSWVDHTYHIWTSSAQPWVRIDDSAVTSASS